MTEQSPPPLTERSSRTVIPRRRVLATAALGVGTAAMSPLLAACGTAGIKASTGQPATVDLSATDRILRVSNWALYIDADPKNANDHPTLDQFTAKTGVSVKYVEDVNDSDSFYAKLAPELRAGQDTGRDVIVVADPLAARLVRQGFVQKLDKAKTPNVQANLISALRAPSWDTNRDFSAPWQSGMTGIAYNAAKTSEVKSIEELFTRPDLKGRVSVLTEWRDTIGLILLQQGKDPANFSTDDFAAAIDYLQKASDSGQIRTFAGSEYTSSLADGSTLAGIAWSGDVVQLQADNPNLRFVYPEAGMMIWADNMLIPNRAQHTSSAEQFMDFYYQPQIAAQVTAYVQYISPVQGARQFVAKIDKTLVDNPLIFPTPELLAVTHQFMGLDEATEKSYTAQFSKVRGS